MNKKQLLMYSVIALILAALIYSQVRTFRHFDWATFWSQTDQVSGFHLLHAVVLIYLTYILRALRWKIFLRPSRPSAKLGSLVGPTMIGFTGLALLGRPGELIRPYLIARKNDLSFPSQLGVWAVERIFDIGAFTILLVLTTFVATAPKRLGAYAAFQKAGIAFAVLSVGLTVAAIAVHRSGDALAGWVERRFSGKLAHLGERAAIRIREFRSGLNAIHGPGSFFALLAVSLILWCMIALSYKEVTHAYGIEALEIPQTQVLLLMGSSMVGSIIQLPGVGGGSQLATIAVLRHIFDVPEELAASCGIMLWLVTFVSVIPLGLILARREHLSLRKLSQESQTAEQAEETVPSG
jgi:glycosyltransferase 2 family protein